MNIDPIQLHEQRAVVQILAKAIIDEDDWYTIVVLAEAIEAALLVSDCQGTDLDEPDESGADDPGNVTTEEMDEIAKQIRDTENAAQAKNHMQKLGLMRDPAARLTK
jgi:ribosomal protein L11